MKNINVVDKIAIDNKEYVEVNYKLLICFILMFIAGFSFALWLI